MIRGKGDAKKQGKVKGERGGKEMQSERRRVDESRAETKAAQ